MPIRSFGPGAIGRPTAGASPPALQELEDDRGFGFRV